MRLTGQSLSEIQSALIRGDLLCETLVSAYLQAIEANKDLNAYIEIFEKEAIQRAKELDQVFREKSRAMGTLWGAVFSLKDVISYEGHQLSAGSKILQGYHAVYSATAVQRLLDADAIIIGRVNCDEFAMGSDNETSFYGPVSNAINKKRVPGGSSGGSAVSVQTDTCLMSLGSDTGGSVRQPASFCDLIGFKPSYGRISRHGLIAYGSSFDQIGIIGHNLNDIQTAYMVMQGPDAYDGTLLQKEIDRGSDLRDMGERPLKLAYIGETLSHEGLQEEIKNEFMQCMLELRSGGHQVDEVSFDLLDYIIPCYYVLTAAEASSNLSRFDGIRYGYRAKDVSQLDEMYTRSRTEGFGTEVKRRILLGTFVLSVGYYDAYFAKAQKIRRLIKEQFDTWTQNYDGVLIPMTPTTAWEIGSGKSPVEIYLADIFSVLANLVGAPAISIPLGRDALNLPFGLQILSANYTEDRLFFLAQSMRNARVKR